MNPKPTLPNVAPQKPRGFQAPKGMHDRLPADAPYWDKIESVVRGLARSYNFGYIETPILEFEELYRKTTGEESDIVEKEMYTLKTKGGDGFALRPEYTPGVCRAYLEHAMSRLGQPQKLQYMGPVFRHDRPQLGRLRQFTQIGFEIIGGQNDPAYDAEVILIASDLLTELKISNTVLKINSIGCRICRPIYKKQLQNFYKNHEKEICEACLRRVKNNPLKLFDCKDPQCAELKMKAPNFLDKLCVMCSAHFKSVLEYLDEVQVPYLLDHTLVRGLDYYSRTVFEIVAEGPESDIGSLLGGGRYDYLMEMIGGHMTPALGFASGAERLIAVMKARNIVPAVRREKKVFVAHAGELAKKKAFALLRRLREQGLLATESLAKESLAAQLKVAGKEGLPIALIMGQKEIYEDSVILRDLKNGTQESVPLPKIIAEIKKRL
jgi:histidyl-tRNA synthetase